jgi:hypothetical protein
MGERANFMFIPGSDTRSPGILTSTLRRKVRLIGSGSGHRRARKRRRISVANRFCQIAGSMQWFAHGETTERAGTENTTAKRFLKLEALKPKSTTMRSPVDLIPREPHSSQDRPSKIRDVERNHNVA